MPIMRLDEDMVDCGGCSLQPLTFSWLVSTFSLSVCLKGIHDHTTGSRVVLLMS